MAAGISRFISQKFRFYTFIGIALLLFVHGYNLNEAYLLPFSTVNEPLSFTTFFEYFMANGILRFRIPLLFIISGYIHALNDSRPYGETVSRRAVSLLIPYILWSAIGLAITYLLQQFPITARAVYESRLDQLGDNRPYSQLGWSAILLRWVAAPIAFQLWFILALFLYNVYYPVIRWLVLKFPVPWFILCAAAWVFELNFWVIDARGLLFFSAGVWLQKTDVNIEQKPRWISMYICWLLFIGFSVVKTFMAFELEPESRVTFILLNVLYTVSVIAGILAIWFGADAMVKWLMRRPKFVWLTSFSFFIFGLHVPLLPYLTRLSYMYFYKIPNYRLLTYLLAPCVIFIFCIVMAVITRKLAPRVYGWLTGGRGLKQVI